MKARYEAPQTRLIEVQAVRLISESTTEQGVHTDNPQLPGNALIKERRNIWEEEW